MSLASANSYNLRRYQQYVIETPKISSLSFLALESRLRSIYLLQTFFKSGQKLTPNSSPVLMGIISVIGGHRKVVNKLTFGILGKDNSSKSYNFMWILTVCLNLSGSATNAFIMKNTKGYGERFNVGQVMLFYTTRPRITWIFAGLLTSPFAKQRERGFHW